VVAVAAAVVSLGLLTHQVVSFISPRSRSGGGRVALWMPGRASIQKYMATEDGRQLLWANGPADLENGEWFDVTDSPLDPRGYEYGLGKDTIPAIDEPQFASINDRHQLEAIGVSDQTIVIGYSHNDQTKAYPIGILEGHELVNDTVGGKPVTVGW
jgi:hypothetical protein